MARGLFTKKDKDLLNQRLGEIFHENSKYVRTTLADGTVVLDLNNKMLLVSGEKLGEEVIHGVFTVNTASEVYAEKLKDGILYEARNYSHHKNSFASVLEVIQADMGSEIVRFYDRSNFSYYRGQHDNGERATLPDDWQNYGYTTGKQDRGGVSEETQNGLPEGVLEYQQKNTK